MPCVFGLNAHRAAPPRTPAPVPRGPDRAPRRAPPRAHAVDLTPPLPPETPIAAEIRRAAVPERRFPVWTAPAVRAQTLDDPKHLVAALESRGEREVPERLARLGIEKLARFSDANLLREIMHNRETDGAGDPRRRALLVFPKWDETHAFDRNPMRDLSTHNHRVLYYEARSDEQFVSILRAEAEWAEATGVPIDFFEIAGHGTGGAVAFDHHPERKQKNGLPPEEDILDWSDVDALLEARLGALMAKNGVIQLNSCSTGYGREYGENIANLMAKIFPEQRIFAPTIPAESTPRFKKSGEFISPGYRLGDPSGVYAIDPAARRRPTDYQALLAEQLARKRG